PRPAGRGDGRVAGERAGRLRRHPWLAELEVQFGACLSRLERADELRRPAERRQGLPRGVARDRTGAAAPLGLARRPARGRTPAGRDAAMSEEDENLEATPPPPLLGAVAIVGFPNVGKSTLINRLTETRDAVVHETSGVTRDRKEIVCEWLNKRFVLLDTGGIDIGDPTPMTQAIAGQAR